MTNLTLRRGVGARTDSELEVKRSRFLTRLVRVETEGEARQVVAEARHDDPGARHHCSAFVLGSSTEPGQIRRSNDDGEPSGTAGRPMLEALTGRGFIDSVAVVTRYFGGVLLGAGGLTRAYSEAVLGAIDLASARGLVVHRAARGVFSVALEHADAGSVESELRQRGVTVLGTDYAAQAIVRLTHPDATALAAIVAAATSGHAVLTPLGREWVDVELDD
ncbi:IMPACT family protein [Glaciibacter psychrotolerans]|uniref:Putative YigZ family protein n=1 Tax=Glaciibacter psychrotolerans TaxID=670054 RepID=A0A7Z0EER1_9MICO|nr:YigZ family protein [Leifsonia psychrotolerans]NYJ20201.1 putative YigZ family protein [Leifsonia psychrotolerans]